jgi:hypothetical protein
LEQAGTPAVAERVVPSWRLVAVAAGPPAPRLSTPGRLSRGEPAPYGRPVARGPGGVVEAAAGRGRVGARLKQVVTFASAQQVVPS